jgi:enoyl-CoA hydratase/carnithine racemase
VDPILVERRGRVGLITLNRPEKLNALNSALVMQLERAVTQLEADDEIGAIVVTGAGERAFSAGGDMAEQVAALNSQEKAPARASASSIVRLAKKPTIAAIRGYCFGGGALMAIEFDIRIGGDDARFKFHAASYGRVGRFCRASSGMPRPESCCSRVTKCQPARRCASAC